MVKTTANVAATVAVVADDGVAVLVADDGVAVLVAAVVVSCLFHQ